MALKIRTQNAILWLGNLGDKMQFYGLKSFVRKCIFSTIISSHFFGAMIFLFVINISHRDGILLILTNFDYFYPFASDFRVGIKDIFAYHKNFGNPSRFAQINC
jgi:hypothetical protein